MPEKSSYFAESNAGAYLLFLGALALFLITWTVLQSAVGLHLTAAGSQFVAILGAALVFRVIMGESAAPWPSFSRLGAGPWALIALLVACVSLAMTANVITSLLVELIPPLQALAEEYKKLIEKLIIDTTGWKKVVAVVSVSLIAPVCEEALFRGTILQEQRKVETFGLAILLNGFMFSTFHLNPVGFVSLWLVGAFFAHLTLSSGTMWVPIIAHAAFNFFNSTVLPEFAPEMSDVESKMSAADLALGLLVLVPITAGFWVLTTRLLEKRAEDEVAE